MKKLFNYTMAALAISAMAACSEDITPETVVTTPEVIDPNAGKELIAFSQEGGNTRSALTRTGFESNTKVVLRIKAQNRVTSNYRYTEAVATALAQTTADDDCNITQYLGAGVRHSHLNYAPTYYRYWDDAFGRDSELEVYAVAVKDKNDDALLANDILTQTGPGIATASPGWYTISAPATESFKIDWSVSTDQTSTTRAEEDLVYSNNIRTGEETNKGRYHQTWSVNDWVKSMELGRLSWQSKDPGNDAVTTGKFDQGHLVFKQALAWITINLKEGTGFKNGDNTDFKWTNTGGKEQAIRLVGFPTSGKLDISTGAWSDKVENVDITQMDETTSTPAAQTIRTLHAYILPGTVLDGNNNNVIQFEIDNAKYYVTGENIADAIQNYNYGTPESPNKKYASFTTIEAGKHYFINLTVAKKAVSNITAAVLAWEDVNSNDADAKNTYCTFDFEDRNTRLTEDDANKFSIYRASVPSDDYITNSTTGNYAWTTGYKTGGTPNKATKDWATDHWTTNWFWEDNKTFYHFRAAGLNESGDVAITTDAGNGDFFTIASGTIGGGTYHDYLWGAPFTFVNNEYLLNYDNTNGFANKQNSEYQISKGIGATDSQIKMLLFHMTSQIIVHVKTTTDESEVTLWKNGGSAEADKTKVEILNYKPTGKVLMGTGKVSADGSDTNCTMSYGTYTAKSGAGTVESPYVAAHVNNYMYGMVPQSLTGVKIRITTPDGNQYEAPLNTCKATVGTTNLLNNYTLASGDLYTIDTWYPHYKYTYTVTVKKTGIQNITAAVLPWEEVTGDLGTIDLEN